MKNMEGSCSNSCPGLTQTSSISRASSALPSSFFNHLSHFNYSDISYGVEGENGGGFCSPLTVMPLKSDGSLCLMEAISNSQSSQHPPEMVTPKMENFFGGATMGTHHSASSDGGGAMALSLDSMLYSQTPDHHDTSGQDILNHLQLNSRQQQQQQIQVQPFPYYSVFRDPELYQEEPKEAQIPLIEENGFSGTKYWASIGLETKMIGCMGENGEESGSIGAIGYGDLQSALSLSMSPGSQSSCVTGSQQISPTAMDTKKRGNEKVDQKQIVHRKSLDTFGQRTSQYRGVTRHRWTGRYEAHLWDNSCKKEGRSRKGRQVYLGGYDMEEKAARSYDMAALKYWGPSTHINFPLENYHKELEEMKNMTRQEFVAHLRRKSSGFSRGASMYRGVTRHHQHGRWQARIGRVAGNKDLYLGTFSTQEEAAEAYDIAAIKFRGVNAVTNFDISRYEVERIMASNTLLAGELARRRKETEPSTEFLSNHISSSSAEASSSMKEQGGYSTADWKMTMHESSDPDHTKLRGYLEDFKGHQYYSVEAAQKGLIRIDNNNSISPGLQHVDEEEPAMIGNHTRNDASSILTRSFSNSEKNHHHHVVPIPLAIPSSSASKYFADPTTNNNTMNSWISSSQLRPHVPVFAAWTDAS